MMSLLLVAWSSQYYSHTCAPSGVGVGVWNLEVMVGGGGVGTLLSFEGSGDWLLRLPPGISCPPDGGCGGLVGWLFVNWIVDASI